MMRTLLYQRADRRHIISKRNCMLQLSAFLLLAPLASVAANNIERTHISYQNQEQVTLQGKVLDATSGEPVSSVTITSQGRTLGTTDASGNFSVRVTQGNEVTFSSIGYGAYTQRITAGGEITVRLTSAMQEVDEVVVTALGIEREKKGLGYAATELKGEQLTEALPNNWSEALSGRVAGVNLVRSGGGPAGSNKIILRGENNLTGNIEALIVIDGVMVSHSSGNQVGTGHGAYLGGDSPSDFGTGINDINPEDIETLTVLKGANATALYGQRGANGAIVITTKKGRSQKGVGVTVTSNATIESISRWPDYQFEYGQGTEGVRYYSFLAGPDGGSTRSTSSAWGPKFDGQYYFQYDPITQTRATERTLWQAYPDERKKFFETGSTFTNSISLDGGNEKTQLRFSFTDLRNSWIIPNTGYERNNVSLTANHNVTDKLKIQ